MCPGGFTNTHETNGESYKVLSHLGFEPMRLSAVENGVAILKPLD